MEEYFKRTNTKGSPFYFGWKDSINEMPFNPCFVGDNLPKKNSFDLTPEQLDEYKLGFAAGDDGMDPIWQSAILLNKRNNLIYYIIYFNLL